MSQPAHHLHAQPAHHTRSDAVHGVEVEVVVIGGGPAGLAAATALGRSRRSVLVLDAGQPRNATAGHVHNVLGHDGIPPADLLALARAEATAYGVEVRADRVLHVRAGSDPVEGADGPVDDDPVFTVVTGSGAEIATRRVVVATGAVDDLPAVEGLRERWGRDVLHCPYCHGWEVRDQAVAVLGTGPMAFHQVLLFRQLSDDVVLVLAADTPRPDVGQLEQLDALGVRVIEDPAVAVVTRGVDGAGGAGGRLVGLRLASGAVLERDAVVVASTPRVHAGFLAGLGLEPVDLELGGAVLGTRIPAEPTGATAVPGVWVAGNAAEPMAQVVSSAAAGLMVGAQLNAELVAADARAAVRDWRAGLFEQGPWEDRYSARDGIWSGRANTQLIAEAESLAPGRALDVGSGEGGDALWLAARGWQVTGLEFSAVARDRAAAHAGQVGVAERVEWRAADVRAWEPGDERWDLVTSHYFHQPDGVMLDVVRRLAAAVAPGGTLLVVGHHPADVDTGLRPGHGTFLFTAEDLRPALDPQVWEVEVAEARTREIEHPDPAVGGPMTVTDAVLRAVRR